MMRPRFGNIVINPAQRPETALAVFIILVLEKT
jgi:hypothetical protein